MRKSLFLLTLIILVSINFTACRKVSTKKKEDSSAVSQKTTVQKEEKEAELDVNLMFVQTAKAAILKKLGSRGYYTLTLYGVNPYSTFYSERPKRISGITAIGDFVKAWNVGENNFHMNNPNALLTSALIDGVANKSSTFYLIKCSTPKYSVQKSILSYVVKPLPKHELMFEHIKLDYVTLMLDSLPGKYFLKR